MRVLLDTNVLASAFGTRGLCTDLFRVVVAEHDLVVGEVVLEELRRVLLTKFRVSAERTAEVEELLRGYEVVARPGEPDAAKVSDAADRWVLASARAANVDVLVTGDAELLTVSGEVPFRLASPRSFWDELRRGAR